MVLHRRENYGTGCQQQDISLKQELFDFLIQEKSDNLLGYDTRTHHNAVEFFLND